MAVTSEAKARIVAEYQKFEGDTGSSAVQIALLSEDINLLTRHIQAHKKDQHSKRGLLLKVNQRNRLLRYLKSKDQPSYQKVIHGFGLRDKA